MRDFVVARNAAPAILEPPTIDWEVDSSESATDSKGRQDENKTASNATLQLSSGFPDGGDTRLGKGPSWTKCVVEQSMSGDSAQILLEEWVMRSERETVNAFRSWREGSASAVARCAPTSLLSTESISCLACIPRFIALGNDASPFTPQISPIPDDQWAEGRPGLKADAILTFNGLPQCMASSFGSGFCKSGSVML